LKSWCGQLDRNLGRAAVASRTAFLHGCSTWRQPGRVDTSSSVHPFVVVRNRLFGAEKADDDDCHSDARLRCPNRVTRTAPARPRTPHTTRETLLRPSRDCASQAGQCSNEGRCGGRHAAEQPWTVLFEGLVLANWAGAGCGRDHDHHDDRCMSPGRAPRQSPRTPRASRRGGACPTRPGIRRRARVERESPGTTAPSLLAD
jgi:hypothetical protein